MNTGLAAKLEAERKLKEGISGHKTGLPKKLLELFEPGPPLERLTDIKKRPPKLPYLGIAQYVNLFAEPGNSEYEPEPEHPRPPSPRRFRNPELDAQARVDGESKAEKKARVSKQRIELAELAIEDGLREWEPTKDPNVKGDPFKTLFVARISHEATEKKLMRELEEFGPIKNIRMVHEKNSGKPRGYAFVEFERTEDMKKAYKLADGRKIEGRRILVDVERGRTVANWRPRRFGGGKGGESRAPRPPKDVAKRMALAGGGVGMGPPSAALPPPPRSEPRSLDRPPPRERPPPPLERDRPRDRPPPPGGDFRERPRDARDPRERDPRTDRERERDPRADRERPMPDPRADREREKERERRRDPRDARDARDPRDGRYAENGERPRRERERGDREDGEVRPEHGGDRKRERTSERDVDRYRDRGVDRSAKRPREDDRGRERRRERDVM